VKDGNRTQAYQGSDGGTGEAAGVAAGLRKVDGQETGWGSGARRGDPK